MSRSSIPEARFVLACETLAESAMVFDTYIARSKRVEPGAWKTRPAGQRLIENIAPLMAALQ